MKPIEISDIAEYRIPGNLNYSPDGKNLSFDVTKGDLEENTYHTSVWLYDGKKARQMTYSLDASSLFWEDNETLILKRKSPKGKEGTTELFRLNIHGSEAEPWITLPFILTSMKKVSGPIYAALGLIDSRDPDAYCADEETRKRRSEEKKAEADYQVVDEVPYWFNGMGFTNRRRTALFLVKTEPELQVERITKPDFDTGFLMADGEMLYYTGMEWTGNQPLTSKVYSYDTKHGRTAVLYGRNDHSFGSLWIQKGQLYAEATDMKAYGVNETMNLYLLKDKKLTEVYRPEVSLNNSVCGDTMEDSGHFRTDGSFLYTEATEMDHTCIYSFDEKFHQKTVWDKPGMTGSFDVKGKKLAAVYQDWNHVAEVYVQEGTGRAVRVTNLNDELLKDRYIARPMPLSYTSDGEKLKGWVLLPEGFNPKKKYPAVLDVHGGPRAAYGETFFHEMQVWAAKGFVVFFTNIRGSDGRGDAFADIRDQYGYVDFRNLMDFTDAVLKKYPNIDPKKVCETGGSYGGFMTNWIITHTDRFCCAASQRSISNWISMSYISDIGPYFGPDQCGASGLNDYEKLWEHSPLKYADQCKTPTLFIHSDEDYRCPLEQGMQMMQALTVRGVETRMCIFHGENHELSRSGKPKHRIRRLNEITVWFTQHTEN